jgi:hypothetical protein
MALRASAEMSREEVNLEALQDQSQSAESGIRDGDVLFDFAGAVVARSEKEMEQARVALLERMGPEALVDSAAIAANFQRMVRVADSTGIPVDTPVQLLTHDIRDELGFSAFGSAANTPALGRLGRTVAHVLKPAVRSLLRLAGRRKSAK